MSEYDYPGQRSGTNPDGNAESPSTVREAFSTAGSIVVGTIGDSLKAKRDAQLNRATQYKEGVKLRVRRFKDEQKNIIRKARVYLALTAIASCYVGFQINRGINYLTDNSDIRPLTATAQAQTNGTPTPGTVVELNKVTQQSVGGGRVVPTAGAIVPALPTAEPTQETQCVKSNGKPANYNDPADDLGFVLRKAQRFRDGEGKINYECVFAVQRADGTDDPNKRLDVIAKDKDGNGVITESNPDEVEFTYTDLEKLTPPSLGGEPPVQEAPVPPTNPNGFPTPNVRPFGQPSLAGGSDA